MCTYGQFMMIHGRNQHNIVLQLKFFLILIKYQIFRGKPDDVYHLRGIS